MGIFRSKLIAVYEKMMDGISQIRKKNMEDSFPCLICPPIGTVKRTG